MPFTPAHAAAALPFRHKLLVTSAVVIGTMAPDFEYFLRLAPSTGFGHTLTGALVLTLPLALIVFWLFQFCVKSMVIALLPRGVQLRLLDTLSLFPFTGFARFLLILISLLLGIATHIVWDNFTHPNTWLYQHWLFLRELSNLPFFGPTQHYKILQHASTVLGLGLLCSGLVLWYRAATPRIAALPSAWRRFSAGRKIYIVAQITVIATAGSVVRVTADLDVSTQRHTLEHFAGEAVCTFIALTWWQLVAYGVISRNRRLLPQAPPL